MWDWFFNEDNRQVLSWLGGGLVVVVGGLWTAYPYFRKHPPTLPKQPHKGQVDTAID